MVVFSSYKQQSNWELFDLYESCLLDEVESDLRNIETEIFMRGLILKFRLVSIDIRRLFKGLGSIYIENPNCFIQKKKGKDTRRYPQVYYQSILRELISEDARKKNPYMNTTHSELDIIYTKYSILEKPHVKEQKELIILESEILRRQLELELILIDKWGRLRMVKEIEELYWLDQDCYVTVRRDVLNTKTHYDIVLRELIRYEKFNSNSS